MAKRGRGRALREAWQSSQADVLSYMDVDLSTGLEAFPALVAAVAEGQASVAVGSRLMPGSRVERCLKREVISRCYNGLVRGMFRVGFSDAQCGFKAITRAAARELVPLVEDNGWFFDTELLLEAERLGHRIVDVPVEWREDADSRVRVVATAWGDLKGLLRIRWRRLVGPREIQQAKDAGR